MIAGKSLPWINMGNSTYWPLVIDACEEEYEAQFVGMFSLRLASGNWSEIPVAMFWKAEPEGNNPSYFGLFFRGFSLRIMDATSATEVEWPGFMAENGEIVFSRWRSDARVSLDGTAMADGGYDFTKGFGTPVSLRIRDGRVVLERVHNYHHPTQ